MEDLRVISVEDGALLVASERGDRYRIEIDEALASKLRRSVQDPGTGRRLSPKDIQAHIRSGLSAQDVASITGAPLEYIQRFEGPILAERGFVIESALAVPVHTARDSEFGESNATFGSAILSRLHDMGATHERWASWKEEGSGWVVKLSFTADQVDHDARWRFDPKSSSLSPLNNEAEALSRQGEVTGTLIPRLRAVDDRDRSIDNTRFDSGAFVDRELAGMTSAPEESDHTKHPADTHLNDTAPHLEAVPYGREAGSRQDAAPTHQTADLLDALRRRRGERESVNFDEIDDAMASHPSTGNIRLVDVPMPESEDELPQEARSRPVQQLSSKSTKRGRASMPTWDEIVFGARSDDDPA